MGLTAEAGKGGSSLLEVVAQGLKTIICCFLPKLARVMGQRNVVLALQKATMKAIVQVPLGNRKGNR